MKTCKPCGLAKPLGEFGSNGYCRPCGAERQRESYQRNRDKVLARQAERYAADPDFHRAKRLQRHGLTVEQYEARLAEQGGACAICGTDDPKNGKRFVVDHDHRCCPATKDGKTCGRCIRGLLCTPCNTGIGQLREDPEVLRSALAYLARHSPERQFA